ncbi:hypothetical protein C5167_041384 [Papaver somniferum]|nr:hypothetical protein C5167_041384 [Papaver somniferum]
MLSMPDFLDASIVKILKGFAGVSLCCTCFMQCNRLMIDWDHLFCHEDHQCCANYVKIACDRAWCPSRSAKENP